MQAISADGQVHEFPDGTDPSVVDRVMKEYATKAAAPAPAAAPLPTAPEGAVAPLSAPSQPLQQEKPEQVMAPSVGGVPQPEAGVTAPSPQPAAEQPPPSAEKPGEFMSGLVGGLLKENPELGAEAFEGFSHLAPESFSGTLLSGSQKLRELSKLSPEDYQRRGPKFAEIGSLGDAASWAAGTLGSGLASMAPTIVTGLAGGAIGAATGSVVPGIGTAAGGVGGAVVGAGSTSFIMNYGEVYRALKEEGVDPRLAAEYASYAAIPMAALDTASVGPIVARLGGLGEAKREVARGIARRILAEARKGAGREAVTEAAQEAVKLATVSLAADKPFWTAETGLGLVESGLAGGLVGGTVGGVAGFRKDRIAPRPMTPEQVREEIAKLRGVTVDDVPPLSPIEQALQRPADGGGPPAGGEVSASAMAPEPKWYYSQVRKVVEEKLPATAPVEQMLATLRNSPGVKPEELEALGIEEWAKGQKGRVSKADLIAHIEENAIEIEERVRERTELPVARFLAVGDPDEIARVWESEAMPGWQIRKKVNSSGTPRFDVYFPSGQLWAQSYHKLEDAVNDIQGELRMKFRDQNWPQYADYNTPGGENPREHLLKMPLPKGPRPTPVPVGRQWLLRWEDGSYAKNDVGEYLRYASKDLATEGAGNFGTKKQRIFHDPLHWRDDPNTLAWFRTTERRDREGKLALHVEEIQSGWVQRGRRFGFNKEEQIEATSGQRRKVAQLEKQVLQKFNEDGVDPLDVNSTLGKLRKRGPDVIFDPSPDKHQLFWGYFGAYRDLEAMEKSARKAVPDLPGVVKTNWLELSVKRILRYAADNGFERVTFSPASEQIMRWRDEGEKAASRRDLYDKMIPNLAGKWAKKLGGKVGRTEYLIEETPESPRFDADRPSKRWLETFHIDITPTMATHVKRGLPQFSAVAQMGKVEILAPNDLPSDSRQKLAAGKQIGLVINQFAKRMGIDIPLKFYFHHDELLSGKPYLGYIHTEYDAAKKPTKFEVHINLGRHATAEEIYATAAHEFGHALKHWYWASETMATKLVLQLDHENWKRKALAGGDPLFKDLLTERDNFIVKHFRTRGEGNFRFSSLDPKDRDYWLNFDEWFAEQTARWMTTSDRPLSLAEKFFHGLARRIKGLFQLFVTLTGKDSAATETLTKPTPMMEKWLNAHLTNVNVTAFEVMEALEAASTQMNQAALNAVGEGEVKAEAITAASILPRTLVRRLGLTGAPAQQARAAAAHADRFNKMYHWMLSMVQVAERNLDIAPLQRYRELWQSKVVEKARIIDGAAVIVKAWRKLGREEGDRMVELIDYYMNMEYLSPQEQQQGVVRRPTRQELEAAALRFRVSAEGLAVFDQIRKSFDDMLTNYGTIMIEAAQRITDPIEQAQRIQEITKQIRSLRQGPYFPAMRFGDFTITVRNAANKVIHFETFESRRRRDAAARLIQAQTRPGDVVQLGKLAKDARPLLGMPPGLLDKLSSSLALTQTQQALLEQIRFELAPAQSFKHRFQRKNKTPGYSQDFLRAYANYFFHGANFFTNARYVDQLRDQVKEVRESARSLPDGTNRMDIGNFLDDHLNYMLNPAPDFARLRGLAFLWYLGFSPAAAALNLTQMLIGSYPFLASKFGDVQAVAAMGKAGANLSTYYRKGTLAAATELELKAISEGVKEGTITEAMAPEIAAISEGRTLGIGFGGNAFDRMWTHFNEMSSSLFELTEQMNRRVTFRAAFALAKRNPNSQYVRQSIAKHRLQFDRLKNENWTDEDAAAFVTAKDATEATQYVYQQYAQPRFMRGRLRTVFVFKTFLQNTLFMLWNYPGARVRSFLVMAFLGGMMGVPGAEDLRGIIKVLAFRLFGKDFDVEDEARRLVKEVLDDKVPADLLLHGMSRYGFNLPMVLEHFGEGPHGWRNENGRIKHVAVDMSRSMGMGQILPFDLNTAFGPGVSKDASRAIAESTQRASGAVFGTGFNMYRALTDGALDWNDFKRWERMMPRFAASVSKSWRAFDYGLPGMEGRERDRAGNTVIRYDTSDPRQMMEAIALGMGYQPLRLTATWDRRMAEMEVTTFWNVRRDGLLRQLWAARGKPEERANVMSAIRKFNDDVRGTSMRGKVITGDTITRSFDARARASAARESGVPRIKADIPIVREIQERHPLAEVDVRRVR